MASSAKDRVSGAKPYVDRAIHDDEVRENIKAAFFAARDVYDELLGGRGATALATRVATDKEVQENLKKVVEELRHAADRVQGKHEHRSRNTMLLLTGVVVGLLFNPLSGPATRQWLKNKVFGAEPEFSYQGSSGGNSGATSTDES
jgi:gas vesicle protein